MSDMVFASDIPNEQSIHAITQWMLPPRDARCFSLVDLALLDHATVASFARRNGLPMINAFANSDLTAFGHYSPHLLGMPDDEGLLPSVVRRLVQVAGNATALSWLQSDAPEPELQSAFTYLAKVRIQDRKKPIHCRFADTRVLTGLLDTLSPLQSYRVASTIKSWCWIGRQGSLQSWCIDAAYDAENDDSTSLRMTMEQFRGMQRLAEPDAIFLMLNQKTPEVVPKTRLGDFHARLSGYLATADRFDVIDIKDRLQFVVLSLTCGEDFHVTPELQSTWKAIRATGASLTDLMQGWSDDLWRRLDARDGKTG